VTAATPGQAGYEAHCAVVGLTGDGYAWRKIDQPARDRWERIAQAVIDSATEGALRACGYTLADVGRFLEAEAAAQQPQPAPGSRSLEDMLADPREQSDLRSELLASISEYAAAPPASAGIQPRHPGPARVQPAPEMAAASAKSDRLEGQNEDLRSLVTVIIDEVSGWSRDPLDTDQLIADWREYAGIDQP
jgi:hypothetical protein